MFGAAPSAVRMCMEKPPCMKLSEGRWVIFPSVYGKPGQALPRSSRPFRVGEPEPPWFQCPLFMAVAQPPKPGPSDGRSAADRLAHCPQRPQRPRVDSERH
jgi:hypothetical protein